MTGPYIVPIYARCGEDMIAGAVVDALFRARLDPVLAPWFGRGGCPVGRLIPFVTRAFGGPVRWDGPLLELVHAGLEVPDVAFSRFCGTLLKALWARGLPDDLAPYVAQVFEPLRPHIVTAG